MSEALKMGYSWQAVAYGFALLISYYVYGFLDINLSLVLQVLIFNTVSTTVVYCFSYAFNNASFYAPYWSIQPIAITLFLIIMANEEGDVIRQLIILAVVSAWGLRLTWNFLRGWKGISHQDWRYTKLNEASGKWFPLISFFGMMLFPTLLVFLGCLPLFEALGEGQNDFNILDIIAFVICLSAFVIQYISDNQLRSFIKNRSDNSQTLNTGLWKYSRHPNYFGEILFWIGIAFFGISTVGDVEWYHVSGVVSMILLFNFISIPMQEKRLIETKSEYYEEIKKRSKLIPWFPKK
jgi:steroid 5-alpha reductase family enzyme